MQRQFRFMGFAAALFAVAMCGCERERKASSGTESAETAAKEVVVYTALDRQFSEPILREFESQTGIKVLPVYDTESTKTVGLTNRIREEATRPRCDVFWNNEILNTLQLKNEGLLQPCTPAEAENYPAQYQDPEDYWYGFAARARVIIVNTDLVSEDAIPQSIHAFANEKWRGQAGIAKPLFGTTASHVACLFAKFGEAEAKSMLQAFKANDVQVVAGNKTCAEMVAAGKLAFGFTDTDDAIIEKEAGRPVEIVFPDSDANEMGTLLLPNTLALIKGCPHPEAGEALINFLLGEEVEAALAKGPSAQIPLHRKATTRSRACDPSGIHTMEVDFAEAARAFSAAAEFIENEFLTN